MFKFKLYNILYGFICLLVIIAYNAIIDYILNTITEKYNQNRAIKICKIYNIIYKDNISNIHVKNNIETDIKKEISKSIRDTKRKHDDILRHLKIENSKKYLSSHIKIGSAKIKINKILGITK